MHAGLLAAAVASVGAYLAAGPSCRDYVLEDFSRTGHGWQARNHAVNGRQTKTGYAYDVKGHDPWFTGPAVDIPRPPQGATIARFTVETSPCPEGGFEMFWAGDGENFSPDRVKRLARAAAGRFVAELPVGAMRPGKVRIRIDSPAGRLCPYVEVRRLRLSYLTPRWRGRFAAPASFDLGAEPIEFCGDGWRLLHSRRRMGCFMVEAGGKVWAEGCPLDALVAEGVDGHPETPDMEKGTLDVRRDGDGVVATARFGDASGRAWSWTRRFDKVREGLRIRTRISCDRPADVLHLPWLTLFADRSSAGGKAQAMLHGVEYLADEPSSNEKEIRGPEANRIMPDSAKLCSPLMLLCDGNGWLAMRWREPAGREVAFSPVFDTPDRLFGTGGHLFALWSPAVGECRRESGFDIYAPVKGFTDGTCEATLTVGVGKTVASALERLFPFESLPPLPEIDVEKAVELLARGWLDSGIRDGVNVRHAVGFAKFTADLASDAPALMMYLASATKDKALAARLTSAADAMVAAFPANGALRCGYGRMVSHICRPVAPLVYGDPFAYSAGRRRHAKDVSAQLTDGIRKWHPPKDGHDYGETLGADHCNGYSAMSAASMMKAALWTGDESAIAAALSAARRLLEVYRDTVPRGAQPWEMPLHCPDIVASGRILAVAVDAYRLSGDERFLEAARYWAASGLSMVYLRDPGLGFCGSYATIGVLGATNWRSTNWIGRPVQWCGLVYAAAAADYAALLSGRGADYWRRIADGIAVSGLRQTYPVSCVFEQGLLPDSTVMATQERQYVPINPGTVEECLSGCIGKPYYSCVRAKKGAGVAPVLHVAGDVKVCTSGDGEMLHAEIDPWPQRSSKVFVARLSKPELVAINGADVPYEWRDGCLSVSVPGRKCSLRIR